MMQQSEFNKEMNSLNDSSLVKKAEKSPNSENNHDQQAISSSMINKSDVLKESIATRCLFPNKTEINHDTSSVLPKSDPDSIISDSHAQNENESNQKSEKGLFSTPSSFPNTLQLTTTAKPPTTLGSLLNQATPINNNGQSPFSDARENNSDQSFLFSSPTSSNKPILSGSNIFSGLNNELGLFQQNISTLTNNTQSTANSALSTSLLANTSFPSNHDSSNINDGDKNQSKSLLKNSFDVSGLSKPFFSAISPSSALKPVIDSDNSKTQLSSFDASKNLELSHSHNITSNIESQNNKSSAGPPSFTSALGKLSSLFNTPNFTSTSANQKDISNEAKSSNDNLFSSNSKTTQVQSTMSNTLISSIDSNSNVTLHNLSTSKPIIDNSSEFNYKLPDHLSQPNSEYVKNYVVPKLGSIEEITKKLAHSHIENKSQLDTLDKLSPDIVDLVQNKDLYYGKGHFKDMNLKPELMRGLFEMGYLMPSRIQEATLPVIVHQRRNLVAQSQNGTGKTGAFALALLSNLDPNTNHPEAVVLAPTYELATQIKSVIDKMAKYMPGMTTLLGIRGNRLQSGTKITEKIVIGTPGTVADWIGKFKFFDPRQIKMFVLDEADVMISQSGHLSMCSRIKSLLPKNCQSLLFSATYPASVCSFANFSVPNPVVIRVKSSDLTLESVKQYYTYVANQDEQFDFAWNLFSTICIAQCIIFCDSRQAAKDLAVKFTNCGFKTSLISGEQSVEERATVIDRLRKGKDKVLIATNVVARGIDISTTSLIINFDIPIDHYANRHNHQIVPDFETYLHRVGRAGRFGVKGICITVARSMQDIDLLSQIQAYYNHEIKPINPWNADQLQNLDPIKYALDNNNN